MSGGQRFPATRQGAARGFDKRNGAARVAALALAALAIAAAASWVRLARIEPALEARTRRRLALRAPRQLAAADDRRHAAAATTHTSTVIAAEAIVVEQGAAHAHSPS